MTTPAAVLTAAADHLRAAPITTYDLALADLLETAAEYAQPGVAHPTHVVRALATARAVLGTDR